MSQPKKQFAVLMPGEQPEHFTAYSAAKRFAEKQSLATLAAYQGDDYHSATWFKADRVWCDGPFGDTLTVPLRKHLGC